MLIRTKSGLHKLQPSKGTDSIDQVTTYTRQNCAVVYRTKDQFGGLSNMAGGYPMTVNGLSIRTSEALYQACRFPHLPNVQQTILQQSSPLVAKLEGRNYVDQSREDWLQVRVPVMEWCLRVKLAFNLDRFSYLLGVTEGLCIVEESKKDDFWGAFSVGEDGLKGRNVLGKLLMKLRDEFGKCRRSDFCTVQPVEIDNFCLLGEPVRAVYGGL